MRAWIVAGIVLVVAVWAPPLSAQVCLGRTLPGELSFGVDAIAVEAWASRISVGRQGESGVGWRLGAVAGGGPGQRPQLQALHGELSYSVEVADGAELCPGVSVLGTLPAVDAGITLFDAFVSFGARAEPAAGITVIPFITPHLAFALVPQGDVVHVDDGPDPYEPIGSSGERDPAWAGGLTAGVGVLIGAVTVRGTATLIAAPTGVHPALGAGVGWRPAAGRR